MRIAGLIGFAVFVGLSGCAAPKTQGDANAEAMHLPQSQLCMNAFGSRATAVERSAAHRRISDAKIDCGPYLAAAASAQQAEAARQAQALQMIQLGQQIATPPPAPLPPRQTNCYSRVVGSQVYTTCQ